MSRQRRPQGRHPKKEKRPPARQFWGQPMAPPAPVAELAAAPDPTAMVRSLGPPPLGSHSGIAGHYFEAVYEKAAALAGALATASGMLDVGHPDDAVAEDEGDEPDDEAGGA
jgi:hypothetical protein